jgi:hypothetical protein
MIATLGRNMRAWTMSVSRARRVVAALGLVAVMMAAAGVDAATVTLSWDAPSTNANGTQLTDLAGYRIYLATTPPPCPGASFHTVASQTSAPSPGDVVNSRITSLETSVTYFARITAVDTSGNESGCSTAASGVAQSDLSVAPTATTSFGSVGLGVTVDRTFTVQNASSATLTGTATIGTPYSVVSGGSFTLSPGASQVVTVRFRPTVDGIFASTVNFTMNGDVVSRAVTGATTGAGAPAPPPAPSSPPDAPASLNVIQTAADATGATFSIGWSAVSGAASYRYSAAFSDGTGAQQGTVIGPLGMQLRMPYHASGAAKPAFVCVRSASAVGVQSTDQSCSGLTVPARSTATPAPGAPVPVASSLSPSSVMAGSAATTLTVTGSAFGPTSVVRWNGAARTTTVVSATELRVALTASDLATTRSVPVTVFTPAPGGGTSGALTFAITARPPAPALSSLSPAGVVAGSGSTTLTLNGSGFVASSVARWNGSARPTTVVSATQLRIALTAADLATARSVPVTVFTPAPGGGTSVTRTFTVTAAPAPGPGPAPGPSTAPAAPGSPSVRLLAPDGTGVTFGVTWSPAAGATSYRYIAAFSDGSAPRSGTVTSTSFILWMPHHSSGRVFGGFVCLRSVNAAGVQSTSQSCSAVSMPAAWGG